MFLCNNTLPLTNRGSRKRQLDHWGYKIWLSHPYYANFSGYPSESLSSLKWHMSGSPVVVRASASLLGRWLQPRVRQHSALSAGQLTFRLAWCREHSAVTAIELWQPLDLAWGTLPVQLRNPDITYGLFRRQREAWKRRSVTSNIRCLTKTLTYLLTYCHLSPIVKLIFGATVTAVNPISWHFIDVKKFSVLKIIDTFLRYNVF